MKFLAILRDSVREAIDTKVFYATLVVSCLIVLLMASVTYRQVPTEEQFRRFTSTMNWVSGFALPGKPVSFDIVDFQQTNDAEEPWRGDYRFTLRVVVANEQDVEDAKRVGIVPSASQLQDQWKQLPWVDQMKVTELKTGKANDFQFLVETKGSKVTDRRGWPHEPALFFGAVPLPIFQRPLAKLIEFIADDLIGTFGAGITMLLSTIITAFFIPNMLRKGSIDVVLAKPIHRVTLLVYKYVGGLTFMFLNTVVIVAGIWLVLGLQTRLWVTGLLACVLVFTFQFAIFYAVSTVMAVLTRSPIVAILTSIGAWVLFFGIGWGYRFVDSVRPDRMADLPREQRLELPAWLYVTADIVHFVTPHYKDLDALTTKLIRSDLVESGSSQRQRPDSDSGSINWTETIVVTVLFIVVMLALACWRFSVKDY